MYLHDALTMLPDRSASHPRRKLISLQEKTIAPQRWPTKMASSEVNNATRWSAFSPKFELKYW
jgi:hypothetical protein